MKESITAIELFAGIGGFRLGLEAVGIKTLWANDINEQACEVYKSNFGKNSIVCDDIHKIDPNDIPKHQLLTAGFPCQPFSPAGKKQGVHDLTRGTLFEKIVDILEIHQPRYFFLENVKRLLSMENGKHFRIILKALSSLDDYFIEWRLINSVNFGIPQNRERVFIFGTRVKGVADSFGTLQDHSVFLQEEDAANGFFESNDSSILDVMTPIDKINRINANWGFAYRGLMAMPEVNKMANVFPPKKLADVLVANPAQEFYFTNETIERIKKSAKVNRYVNGVEVLFNQEGGARLGYTVFGINGIASTLTASTSRHYERYKIGNHYRRLTNIEYARLMGFPDDWCRVANIYNQYGLYGNAVIPKCIQWVASRIGRKNFQMPESRPTQLTFAFR